MANQAAAPAPNQNVEIRDKNCELLGVLHPHAQSIIIDTATCAAALIIALTFVVAASQHRLWHSNGFLRAFLMSVGVPAVLLLNTIMALVLAVPFRNDLYLVWLVMLVIAYESTYTIAGYGINHSNVLRIQHECIRVYNNGVIMYLIFFHDRPSHSKFFPPLCVLWILFTFKLVARIIAFRIADRAYGKNNTFRIAHYMKGEHSLSGVDDVVDPATMKGYKYLVLGEEKLAGGGAKKVKDKTEFCLKPGRGVVTVEDVWGCRGKLITSDADGQLKDVCLSFALFKLLTRQFFGDPPAESSQQKTRDFVFQGLLTEDRERVFRAIKMELGFLRDLFYTRCPITFCRGFPTSSILQVLATFGVSLWIAVIAFRSYSNPADNEYLSVNGKNVDLYLTYVLVCLIMLMEISEVLVCVFSDWTKVMLICCYVRHRELRNIPCLAKVLAFFCRPKFSRSLHNNLGQYDLLQNFDRFSFRRCAVNTAHWSTCGFMVDQMGRGVHRDPPIKLPEDVKEAVYRSLRNSDGQLSNGESSLKANGKLDRLGWACRLPTHIHTIMVWHIATGLCEIRPTQDQSAINAANKPVATSLSKYCAYLVVHVPDLLPVSFAVDHMFDEIVEETSEFFEGLNTPESKWDKILMHTDEREGSIVEMGATLARLLTDINDDKLRWKVLADLWSQLLVFLAPSACRITASQHKQKLAEGGEFITQLWALLYHAGITERPQAPPADAGGLNTSSTAVGEQQPAL